MMAQPISFNAPTTPPLVLCADGGGSKVMVVIRSSDGVEVRAQAGPCNVQSVGHVHAIQRILLATYRALALLPPSHLPSSIHLPSSTRLEAHSPPKPPNEPALRSVPATPAASRPGSPPLLPQGALLLNGKRGQAHKSPLSALSNVPSSPRRPSAENEDEILPPIEEGVFQYLWLGLAGISNQGDARGFMPHVARWLGAREANCKITNDVNLLAAPALDIPGVEHVLAVVCGTGTVGRTIRIQPKGSSSAASSSTAGDVAMPSTDEAAASGNIRAPVKQLPLEDVGVSRGWGYMLCDEGSAFHLGRLALRSLLFYADRLASSRIYSAPTPPLLPLHSDLLAYFGTADPMDLIEMCSLTGPGTEGLSTGEVTARRNAKVAGAARTVLRWAFEPPLPLVRPSVAPEQMVEADQPPPSPESLGGDSPALSLESATTHNHSHNISSSSSTNHIPDALARLSQTEALKLARSSILPMVDLTLELLGDGTVVQPSSSVLALGGGLMMNPGYRGLLLDGLKRQGVSFKEERVVDDAAGVGARGLAGVEFAGL